MKKYIFFLFLAFGLNACYDENYEDNNLIPNRVFNFTKNLNLPENQGLLVPFGYVIYKDQGYTGANIIVYNVGGGIVPSDFVAYDLACPHVSIDVCSRPMEITNLPELTNSCEFDGIFYSLESYVVSATYLKDSNGDRISIPEGQTAYQMQEYKVDLVDENVIRISNF
tara:strand:+ start:50565 stop:51068 length:504 start_codon:yes stop_codon:yes gene_type:complete